MSQVELKPQWGLFQKEKKATVSAVLGGLESPGNGEEAGPGYARPCRHSENSGCLSRAVRSQKRL